MDVDILHFAIQPSMTRLAIVRVRYHEMEIMCELVYHVGSGNAWIRMPEFWLRRHQKVRLCFWPTKEISDDFQKTVLNKIFDKYDLSLEKVASLHAENKRKRVKDRNE